MALTFYSPVWDELIQQCFQIHFDSNVYQIIKSPHQALIFVTHLYCIVNKNEFNYKVCLGFDIQQKYTVYFKIKT